MVTVSSGVTRRERTWSAVRRAGVIGAVAAAITCSAIAAEAAGPGGFVESAESAVIRPQVTVALPERGRFTFPAPYNTTGVRLTNASDCGGRDCVWYVGYSYWRRMNNHAGSDSILVFMTLDPGRGGTGPTLFRYDKASGNVTVVGPLFSPSSPFYWATGEGWYFSASLPTKLYMDDRARLYRYDVASHTFETVFDVTAEFGPNRYIWQYHSSSDDTVHSATLRDSATDQMLGCLVYREPTHGFSFFPRTGDFDECQIDKSGRWLVIKDNVDGRYGEDNVIVDLASGGQTAFWDQNGAAGHSDTGMGYMVAEDNFSAVPGAVRLWTFGEPFPTSEPGNGAQGRLVYHTTDWNADIGHLSHSNASAGAPASQQYACGANASRANLPRNNEIVCFPLDGSLRVLVVAPVMTDPSAAGGGDDYAKAPKGNLDVTGEYFIWTSNAGGNRLDAFIVRIPGQLLTGSAPPPATGDTAAPSVAASTSTAPAVTWTGAVNVAVDGNALRKTSGCDGCADAGAVSRQRMTARGGVMQFTASEAGTLRYVGLSRGSAASPDMEFGLRLQSGNAEVRERGVYRADVAFQPGDVFQIKVRTGAVKYLKNGRCFYTSTAAPAFPLAVSASLASVGATVQGVTLSGR